MADPKTKPTTQSAKAFLNTIDDEQKRGDCLEILTMMEKITGEPAVMWGPSIVGFGTYHYKYASGHEGDICMVGFAPRKQSIVLYLDPEFDDRKKMLDQLGKHKVSVACLYIKRLSDVDKKTLEKMIKASFEHTKQTKL